jgi:hypothetical protein
VRAEVQQAGARDDLPPGEVGEPLADRGGGSRSGAVVVAGDAAGVLGGVGIEVQGDEEVGPRVVGEGGALGR